MEEKYQPKGRLCATCKHAQRDCSELEFDLMPVLSKQTIDGKPVNIVKCLEHERGKK